MALNVNAIEKGLLLRGNFGLEREALRVTEEGRFAQTPHPFPYHRQITRDFCENQTEINTPVFPTAEAAVDSLRLLNAEILGTLRERCEFLWPFSNPPRIGADADIPTALFGGDRTSKTAYREYLASKYGKRLMTFSGIHVNFSFADELIAASAHSQETVDLRAFKDGLYLHVAENAVAWGWVLTALTAASPILDASYLDADENGDRFLGKASMRTSAFGYWNDFVPVLDYGSLSGYAASIGRYVRDGFLASPSELYYPIRLKPRGLNNLDSLVAEGVSHIELRMFDLNPLVGGLVDVRDVAFAQLFLVWCAASERIRLSSAGQVNAVKNFKAAADYNLDTARIVRPDTGGGQTLREAGLSVLDRMEAFFKVHLEEVLPLLSFQREKLLTPSCRYAEEVRRRFSGSFLEKGLAHAKRLTEEA